MRISDWSSDVCSSDLAGYPEGFEVDIYGYRERHVTEAIIGNLQNVGIRANLNWVRFATFKEMNFEGKIPLRHGAFGSWSINDVSITMEGFFQGVEEDTTQDPQLIEWAKQAGQRSEEHTSELQSLMRISYAVFCLKKKQHNDHNQPHSTQQ